MEMTVDFPGGVRVDAHVGRFTVATDQPVSSGGEGSAPSPFAVFLASLATCAGFYVLGFCRQRNLPTDGIRIVQRAQRDPQTGIATEIEIVIQVPESFPQKYYDALVRSADQCLVKKTIEQQPRFNVHTEVV